MTAFRPLFGLVLCVLLCASCDVWRPSWLAPRDESPVVAKVGSVKLTLAKLDASIPRELAGTISPEQKVAYVKQWIDAEILAQAAVREKLDRDPAVKSRLAETRRSVLGAAMIDKISAELTSSNSEEAVTPEALAACYEANRALFTRKSDAVRYAAIMLPDMQTAWTVRNAVTADNFFELGKLHSKTPLSADPASIPFTSIEALPKALADVVFGIKVGGTTSPIGLPDGFAVVRVLDKQKSGDLLPLSEVEPQVRLMLGADSRRTRMERKMADLRQKVSYEFNLNLLSGSAGEGQ